MDDIYAYEPPLSLWALVEQFVPCNERDEVKNMLGESMVDQSMELHLEVNTLLEIWRDFRDESTKQMYSERLPEPPEVRERLRAEIMFFLENIREKAGKRDANRIFASHNQDVIKYACDASSTSSSDTWSRPNTARSSNGRETPMRCTPSSASDRVSSLSSVSDDVEAMHDKLNILHLDEVTQHLRAYLEEEVEQLLKDIEFLQECLEKEADFRDNSGNMTQREPTLTELREERVKLEKELLTETKPVPPAIKKSPIRPSHDCMKTGSARIRTPGKNMSPPNTTSSRPKPLKASHDVATKVLEFPNQNQNIRQNVLNNNNILKDRTDNVPNNAKLVKVGSIPVSATEMTPVPPTSARPSSASRFRRMVLDCRDSP